MQDGVTIVLNRKGRNSGDAFVEFATKEMAEKALKRDREVIGNRLVYQVVFEKIENILFFRNICVLPLKPLTCLENSCF